MKNSLLIIGANSKIGNSNFYYLIVKFIFITLISGAVSTKNTNTSNLIIYLIKKCILLFDLSIHENFIKKFFLISKF